MEKNSIFDKSWFKKDDEFDKEEYQSKKRELQRMFEAQYDRCDDLILECRKKQRDMEKDRFEKFNLNSYREVIYNIADYERTKKEIEDLFDNFFGEKIKR